MDKNILVLGLVRGGLSLLFVICGFTALVVGARLYYKGMGHSPDGSSIDASGGKFKLSASLKTVGSMMMITSILWGLLAYLSLPRYEGPSGQAMNIIVGERLYTEKVRETPVEVGSKDIPSQRSAESRVQNSPSP